MRTLLSLLLIASPLLAQQQQAANPAVAAVREYWSQSQDYLLRSAEQMPESLYSYRPTPQVRTFGEILNHVSASELFYCAAALGEKTANMDSLATPPATKAGIVKAMRDAGTYCARAYAITDAAAGMPSAAMGRGRTNFAALVDNAGHNMEHYGNLVTYFRITGMVPPSSQPSR